MEDFRLGELIGRGEGQTTECKKSLSLQDKGFEALCAMVNAEPAYGVVAFGVERDGTVCGIEPGDLDTAQRSLSQTIKNKFEPHLITQMQILEMNNKTILLLSAARNRSVPYHEYDGRAWIREGTTNRMLSLSEKQMFSKNRNRDNHPGPWKCNRYGSFVGSLNSFVYSSEGLKKSYYCDCGGEFWPA